MRIYLDHNATTPPRKEVRAAMMEAMICAWANPSSAHEEGRAARSAVEEAREKVAALVGCRPEEIVFVSGGTEGNNTALRGAVRSLCQGPGRRQLVTSRLEHPSVRMVLECLAGEGYPLAYLRPGGGGRIDPEALRQALRERDTLLVSLQLVNHEVGTLQDVAALAALSHEHGALFHCDAVQAVGRIPVNIAELGVDLLTMSAHKLYGPKGIGALYISSQSACADLSSLHLGGQQEKGRRAGTENVAAIAGFGVACELAREGMARQVEHVRALRDRLEEQLMTISGARVHGERERRAPGTLNIGFQGVEGEVLMMSLDLRGVAVSTGAACSSGSHEPSQVLSALGLPPERALEAVRFSVGIDNTAEQIDQVALAVRDIVAHVRGLHGTLRLGR